MDTNEKMNFLERVFSDNGEPSSTRVLTGMVVAASIGWVSAVVRYTHALPDFAGLSMFIGTLYGLNVVRNFAGPKPPESK